MNCNALKLINSYEYFELLIKMLHCYIYHIMSTLFIHFQLNEREGYQRLSLSGLVCISEIEL